MQHESYPKTNHSALSVLHLVQWRREGMRGYADHVQQVWFFH